MKNILGMGLKPLVHLIPFEPFTEVNDNKKLHISILEIYIAVGFSQRIKIVQIFLALATFSSILN